MVTVLPSKLETRVALPSPPHPLMTFLFDWLLVQSVSENGINPVPFYTKIIAVLLSAARFCGGLEEFFAILICLLGIYFGVRARLRPPNMLQQQQQQQQTARQARRSLIRSPMALCLVLAAIIYRQRPGAIRWALPASEYHVLPSPSSDSSSTAAVPSLLSPTPPDRDALQTKGAYFRDELNRIVILRGVNLGGGSKLPTSPYSGETFRSPSTLHVDSKEISFVDRPFPLKDADEHFGRLAAWGFTFLRLQVTWEAVEHAGPGIYDVKYLKYLLKLVRIANKFNMKIFIDPHQDVWSRFTGGSGAPSWTLELVGFNVKNLHSSGAAFVHQEWNGHRNNNKKGRRSEKGTGQGSESESESESENIRPLPGQVWGHNYARLASATMFSLFFGGRDFAPNLMIENVNIQDYLQTKYCQAMAEVARYLRDEKNVVGFDTLNEPSNGYIGYEDISNVHAPVPIMWDMSPFALMTLAAGFTYNDVPFYSSPMVYVL